MLLHFDCIFTLPGGFGDHVEQCVCVCFAVAISPPLFFVWPLENLLPLSLNIHTLAALSYTHDFLEPTLATRSFFFAQRNFEKFQTEKEKTEKREGEKAKKEFVIKGLVSLG